ncbi:hypothetical protein FGIG_01033 [Fasciola gigantica]|uniref:Uncharacterized protein n=1 Tax=Fasciola gigantica TaxID=46835 RepID=A0A504Z1T0_FASGI|nr:hypothetical protein FGIG_01033 [Fasciola gigantica]
MSGNLLRFRTVFPWSLQVSILYLLEKTIGMLDGVLEYLVTQVMLLQLIIIYLGNRISRAI